MEETDELKDEFVDNLKKQGYKIEIITLENTSGETKEYIITSTDYMIATYGEHINPETKEPEPSVCFDLVNESLALIFRIVATDIDKLKFIKDNIEYAIKRAENNQELYIQ